MTRSHWIPTALALGLMSACGSLDRMLEEPVPTLADLQPVSLSADAQSVPRMELDELALIYRDVLERQRDATTRLAVSHRLADIEMLHAEEKLSTATAGADFTPAIAAYEQLLVDNPDYPRRDDLLYQLSKAYSLDGDTRASQDALQRLSAIAPDSPHLPEAYFRQAERAFVEADYASAESLYTRVVNFGADTPYFTRALYMQGWSRFKQDDYAHAIAAFTASLDQLLPAATPVEALPRAQQELVQDSLRVMAIVFSRQQGTDSIAGAYNNLGERHYEHLLYESLGALYLSQERYDDSAGAYQAFVQRYPQSRRAHRFQLRVIEAYEAGGFNELIVQAKRDYVASFPVAGAYWQASDGAAQQAIATRLRRYIPELASHHHALAQEDAGSDGATAQYRAAARYYALYLDSFPEDPAVPRLTFLLAESQYEAGDYAASIAAYDWVAYIHGSSENAADAGYTAILAHEKLAAAGEPESPATLRQRIDSELRFQAAFPGDPRANTVLGHAASALLELRDYPAALAAATTLVDVTPAPDDALLTAALLVIGHSQFELEEYAAAEAAYSRSLEQLPAGDARREATVDRLAAAMYRQGEHASALGDDALAAAHFQRVMSAAPASSIAVNAQYDAAHALLRSGEPGEANRLLLDFRKRYPAHPLTAGIGATLLQNYEQLGLWREAAGELDTLRAEDASPEVSRQSLILAARYYERAGDIPTAITRYRSYANDWPQPVADNLEAITRLAQLYADTGATDKRHFWLRKTIEAHDEAGAEQTGRTAYLAASAAAELADSEFAVFADLRITQPLKRTVAAKKNAMETVLAGYNRCNRYAVEQFITRCTYRLGEVYRQFSRDLLASERPQGLDALALEQYEIMLEEQAYPFEEKAIDIHESNALRSRKGTYDRWVRDSFAALGALLPARYAKREATSTEALAALARSETADTPGRVLEYNLDAIALREMGDFSAAEEAYASALALAPDDPLTHRNIGILYDLYLGLPGRAIYHYGHYQAMAGGGDRAVAGWIADLERRHVQLAKEDL